MCGGVILRCLSTQLEQITNDACQKEVRYFQMMETNDFNNDVIMAAACRKDVETFCANVTAGGCGQLLLVPEPCEDHWCPAPWHNASI
jgi:Golgi apparatus protein 1